MVNRRGGIGHLFLVKTAEFKMRRRRLRVCFERLLKRINCAGIIHRIDAALAEDEMRLLFLVRLPLARRAAAQRGAEQGGQRAERKSNPESHDVKLNEPAGACNRGLRPGRRNPWSKPDLRFAAARRNLVSDARVAEWQTRQT